MNWFKLVSAPISYSWAVIVLDVGGETGKRVTETLEMLLIASSVWNCYTTVATKKLIFQTR